MLLYFRNLNSITLIFSIVGFCSYAKANCPYPYSYSQSTGVCGRVVKKQNENGVGYKNVVEPYAEKSADQSQSASEENSFSLNSANVRKISAKENYSSSSTLRKKSSTSSSTSRSKSKRNSNDSGNSSDSSDSSDELLNDSIEESTYGSGSITKDDCYAQGGHPQKILGSDSSDNLVCIIPQKDGSNKQAIIVDGPSKSSSPVSQSKESCSVDPSAFTNVIASCREDNSSAATRCNDDKDAKTFGLPGSGTALGQVGQMLGGATGGCGKMADLAKGAAGAFAAFEAQCSQAISSCQVSCSNAKAEIEKALVDVEKKCVGKYDGMLTPAGENVQSRLTDMKNEILASAKQCSDNQTNIALAQQNGQSLAMQMAASEQCKAQFSSVQNDICKVYPNMPACASNAPVDCSVAANATKADCICKVNPNDPLCPSGGVNQKMGNQFAGGSNSTAAGLASLANQKPDFGSTNNISDNSMDFNPSGTANKSASKSGGVPEGKGSGLGGGGGAGASHGGDPQGHGGTEDAASRNGNISYGRGGSGGGSMGGYGSGSNNGNDRERYITGANGKTMALNFRKWLPGQSNDPKRNIAGMVGPDGITCATCGTIFDKVGVRYQKVKSTLQSD